MKPVASIVAALVATASLAGCVSSTPAPPPVEQQVVYIDAQTGAVTTRTVTTQVPKPDPFARTRGILPDPSCSRCMDTVLSDPAY
jgi:ABC-type uncharacterized transport system auxiliary subunit